MSVKLGMGIARDALHVRSGWILSGFLAFGAVLAGVLQRVSGPAYAADRALVGATFGAAVPVFCYVAFGIVHRRAPTAALLDPFARHGADRRLLALGLFVALGIAAAVLAAFLGIVTVLAARLPSDPELARDLFACSWSGASIGAAYVGLFAVGSMWGQNGRLVLLFADFIFGSGSGVLALPFPRGHARNLLGGEPVLGMSQSSALLLLWLFAVLGVGLFARRVPR